MIWLILVIIVASGAGYFISQFLNSFDQNYAEAIGRISADGDLLPPTDRENAEKNDYGTIEAYFDPTKVTIGPLTNQSLEEISDLIIENYIDHWYKSFSNNKDFPIQMKAFLQYLCAVIVQRLKKLNLVRFITQDVIPLMFEHIDRTLSSTSSGVISGVSEESILCGFGVHLHEALSSRRSEMAYLRSLVSQLLPYVSIPPSLSPTTNQDPNAFYPCNLSHTPAITTSRHSSHSRNRITRSVSSGAIPRQKPPYLKLGSNRSAHSFLVEILSTCVLLPGLDALANSDFLNQIIIICLSGMTDKTSNTPDNSDPVPILNSYVKEWQKWLSEKPRPSFGLDSLLCHKSELYPFMQYMKSVKSTAPLTVVLLMNDIDQRISHEPLTPDTIHEVSAQVRHILGLLHGSNNPASKDDWPANLTVNDTHDFNHSEATRWAQGLKWFTASTDFASLLENSIKESNPDCFKKLVATDQWKSAYALVYKTVESHFLPLYAESPEYLSHCFGLTHRTSFSLLHIPRSPKRVRRKQSSPTGFFGDSFKTVFGVSSMDSQLLQNLGLDISKPPPSRPKALGRANRSADEPETGQHLLHAKYLSQKQQIDLSDWHVFIPGLSRPEIQRSQKRIIDTVAKAAINPINALTQSNSSVISPPSTGANDMAYKDKINNELLKLRSDSNASVVPLPQLSPQFMFTVRTERIKNGAREPVTRVDRKYAEFYVLEQKLVEFHGSDITKQLPPRRQLAPRTVEFLESKREAFEEYLQYLITQPFLRNSELLYGFLTSNQPFASNLFFDINLGRFVKSMPLKLSKEKGQYLDDFLFVFYVSCHPQPIESDTAKPSILKPDSDASILFHSNTNYFETLTEHYSMNQNSQSSNSLVSPSKSRVHDDRSRTTQCTLLDHRLRSRIYWNNAGLTYDRKHITNEASDDCTVNVNGPFETILFLFDSLSAPVSHKINEESDVALSTQPIPPQPNQTPLPTESSLPELSKPVQPWDLTHTLWGEALLNAPEFSDPFLDEVAHVQQSSENMNSISDTPICDNPVLSQESFQTISLGLPELQVILTDLYESFIQHVRSSSRQLILQLGNFLRFYIKKPIDSWLLSHFSQYLSDVINDQRIALMLKLLKNTIFAPSTTVKTDLSKSEREQKARSALHEAVLSLGLAYFTNPEEVCRRIDLVFECFQRPKLNKQLTYVLLDKLVLELFPELASDSANV